MSTSEAAVSTGEAAVVLDGLRKRYGNVDALDGFDLVVPAGSVFGLIGPNGAGKTTVMSIIATLLRPTSGTASVLGHDPVRAPRDVRRVLGYMPDVMGVNERLTVEEYLTFFAHACRVPRARWEATVASLLELVALGDKRDALVDSLSRGMKQRVSLARALVHDPQLLVLDEPASGLDPQARVELQHLVRELQSLGKTIIVSSHILSELEEMCSDVAIVDRGQVIASGPTSTLAAAIGVERRVRIRFADGTERVEPVRDDDEAAALLHHLVAVEQRRVVEFVSTGTALESAFLHAVKQTRAIASLDDDRGTGPSSTPGGV